MYGVVLTFVLAGLSGQDGVPADAVTTALEVVATPPDVTVLLGYGDENGNIIWTDGPEPATDSDQGGEVVAYAMVPSVQAAVCYTKFDDLFDGHGPGPNPWRVYGTAELVDVEMIQGWDETYHPFDTWSEEPGVPGVYFNLNVPLNECDGCDPVGRCSFNRLRRGGRHPRLLA